MPTTVLIVEDEPAIRQMISVTLERVGIASREAGDAVQALDWLGREPPDLLVLDWMLPGRSGLDLARQLRLDRATARLPILFLTARAEEEDKIRALEGGADDYLTKPFSPRELVARIRALIRRATPEKAVTRLIVAGLTLDPAAHRVEAGGKPVDLGPTEFKLLQFFMSHPDHVHTRDRILDRVWGRSAYIDERTVDVHILRLRKALSGSGHDRLVQTIRGTGYRFSPESAPHG